MPGLRCFGRSWLIATDDFPIPAMLGCLFHSIWTSIIVVALAGLEYPKACKMATHYKEFLGVLLFCFIAAAVTYLLLFWQSLQGSIYQVNKRKWVPVLLYILFITLVSTAVINAYGTVIARAKAPDCFSEVKSVWRADRVTQWIVYPTWAMLGLTVWIVLVLFNAFQDHSDPKSWEFLCGCMARVFCCHKRMAKGADGVDAPMLRLAQLLSSFFGAANLTASDIAAGMILVGMEQSAQSKRAELPGTDNSSTNLLTITIGDKDYVSLNGEEPRHPGAQVEPLLSASSVTAPSDVPLTLLKEAQHWFRYALGVYGWQLYIWAYLHQVDHYCDLCCASGGCCPDKRRVRGKHNGAPPANVMQQLTRKAIFQFTDIKDEDLLYIQHRNEIAGEVPYFITLDRPRRCVVLAIRGSMSLADCVTDLLCGPAPIPDDWLMLPTASPAELPPTVPGSAVSDNQINFEVESQRSGVKAEGPQSIPPQQDMAAGQAWSIPSQERQLWAHTGILQTVRWLLGDIDSHGILAALLTGDDEARRRLRNPALQHLDCRGWTLLVTGHSLGAGAAALATLQLKTRFPNVRCWAFSPPAGLMCPEAARLIEPICTSIVYSKDMIPRLSLATMEVLRDKIVNLSAHCRLSKAQLVAGSFLGKRWPLEKVLEKEGNLDPEVAATLEEYHMTAQKLMTDDEYRHARAFVPPGRLVWLEPLKTAIGKKGIISVDELPAGAGHKGMSHHRIYRPRFITADELLGTGVVVSQRMFSDHVPDRQFFDLQETVMRLGGQPKGPVRRSHTRRLLMEAAMRSS